jgi:chemotaxis protein methyltransferase CheR
MRWAGFRKVRRQLCKRLQRHIRALDVETLSDYRAYLARVPGEWAQLDGFCRITISRFYRDREVHDRVCGPVLQALAAGVRTRGEHTLKAWSAGCGRGEEPYTLAIAAHFAQPPLADLQLEILATDIDPALLAAARDACYRWSSLKDLPRAWIELAFEHNQNIYCLRAPYRQAVYWLEQDIRTNMADGRFDLIMCRNLVFTYFDDALQRELLARLIERLQPDGALVIGKHEALPEHAPSLVEWFPRLGIYRVSR